MSVHDTSGLDCWCDPLYEVRCDCDAGCPLCEGSGWRTLTRAEAEFAGDAVHVVHQDVNPHVWLAVLADDRRPSSPTDETRGTP